MYYSARIKFVLKKINSKMSFGTVQLKVPDGLPSLLEKLAMEVLRKQPKNIVDFSASYLNQLLKERENSGVDIDNDQSSEDTAAITLQKNFRGRMARKDFEKKSNAASKIQKNYHQHYLRRCESATIIQASYRGYKIRKSLKKSNDDYYYSESYRTQLETSATKIQASFRGYHARKSLKIQNESQSSSAIPEIDETQLDASATKIQASYRGYRARKEVEQRQKEVETFLHGVEDAAITIQKNYRGYSARKKMKKAS